MIKLITHNDLDGVGCYIIANYILHEQIDANYCNYKNVNDVVLETLEKHDKYEKIFITDISVNEEVANKLDKIKDKVQLLDHHPTALFLNNYDWANVEIECSKGKTCGTQMLFDYLEKDYNNLSEPTLKYFIELVRRYDTWEWKDKYNDLDAKHLNDLMYIIGIEDFIIDMLTKIDEDIYLFDKLSLKLLEIKQKEIDRYVDEKDKTIMVKEILGYNAGIVFAENHISELGNRLNELHPELDFIIIINREIISYRTIKDNINLSEIAKVFGGGGHPKASGSQIDECCIDNYIKNIFNIKA
ncbi:DHHA1 domain-containing protein [Clostridioides difficile]|nr:DHHA1 domain-containing protein [Clostridioides difficile]